MNLYCYWNARLASNSRTGGGYVYFEYLGQAKQSAKAEVPAGEFVSIDIVDIGDLTRANVCRILSGYGFVLDRTGLVQIAGEYVENQENPK